ncbi:TIGR00341 family protein [Halostella salina]|uniref:TIGR00341 family protein n=1 Tax=Halostella salina TaxID=1547897 RepID=UPI0013CE987D|nr:TIGR00341 family protein [Halostella salina]
MRLVQIRVPDDRRGDVTDALDDEHVDYVVLRDESDAGGWVVEFPLPTDAVGTVRDRLREAGFPEDGYTVIGSAEAAMTPHSQELADRFADDFDPLTPPELTSKARDLSRDPGSYVAMILLSAVIATAGLLVDSPAIIVGSMVIAPLVGPVLTTGVGAALGDTEMFRNSLWLQIAGVVAAVAGAWLFAFALRAGGFVADDLAVTSIELVALRLSPSVFAMSVGLAAGVAAGFGLTTKGPTSLIGVMIAAALIPTAATTGIAMVWGYYVVAVGTLFLLVGTLIAINVGVYALLWGLGYRSGEWHTLLSAGTTRGTAAVVATVMLVVATVGVAAVGTGQQVAFQQSTTAAVEDVVGSGEYADLQVVSVRPEYTGVGSAGSPETVTVVVSKTSNESYPGLAADLRRAVAARTGEQVTVRVSVQAYQVARGPGNATREGVVVRPVLPTALSRDDAR